MKLNSRTEKKAAPFETALINYILQNQMTPLSRSIGTTPILRYLRSKAFIVLV